MTRRRPAAAALLTVTVLAGSLIATRPAQASTPFSALVAKADTPGPGYRLVVFPGSRSLSQPTLRLCTHTFPSDRLRAERYQVEFQPAKKGHPFVSEELVHYRKGKGAVARVDLAKTSASCSATMRLSGGGSVHYSVHPAHLTGAPAGAVVLREVDVFSGVDPRPAISDYLVYVNKGDTLIGVYGGSTAADQKAIRRVAADAARKLAATPAG